MRHEDYIICESNCCDQEVVWPNGRPPALQVSSQSRILLGALVVEGLGKKSRQKEFLLGVILCGAIALRCTVKEFCPDNRTNGQVAWIRIFNSLPKRRRSLVEISNAGIRIQQPNHSIGSRTSKTP